MERDLRDERPPAALALVVVWTTEPQLLGRAFVVPPTSNDECYIVGRGNARRDHVHARLLAIEDCPQRGTKTRAVESPHISRDQLLIRPLGADALTIQNVGQCRLFHNREETTFAKVYPNDTLRLGRDLLLICVKRAAWIHTGYREIGPSAYGEADPYGLVGESPAIWAIRHRIALAASRKEHVLITGESGTGKEVAARALHAASMRSHRAFVARNAATFPEALVDAELFGNAKNYPNPGMPDRPGLFGFAHQATLFLDEIAEMPALAQSHLLRVLDCGEYQRLGESVIRYSDFRLIGATNRPALLRDDVAARLKLSIALPTLGERREDIPFLTRHLLRRMAAGPGSNAQRFFPDDDLDGEPRVSLEFMELLVRRSYTTHLRELEQLLWQAMDDTEGAILEPAGDVGQERPAPAAPTLPPPSPVSLSDRIETPDVIPPARSSKLVETASPSKEQIVRALEENDWVVQRAWRSLGLRSRHALNRLIARFAIRRPKQPTS